MDNYFSKLAVIATLSGVFAFMPASISAQETQKTVEQRINENFKQLELRVPRSKGFYETPMNPQLVTYIYHGNGSFTHFNFVNNKLESFMYLGRIGDSSNKVSIVDNRDNGWGLLQKNDHKYGDKFTEGPITNITSIISEDMSGEDRLKANIKYLQLLDNICKDLSP